MQDLPSDIEVLKEIDTSNLDEVFQDYVFASYFLSYMAQKGTDKANRLEQENLELNLEEQEIRQLVIEAKKNLETRENTSKNFKDKIVADIMKKAEETS